MLSRESAHDDPFISLHWLYNYPNFWMVCYWNFPDLPMIIITGIPITQPVESHVPSIPSILRSNDLIAAELRPPEPVALMQRP